jgi:hypothetical protein
MSKPMKAMPPTVVLLQHEVNRYRCELRQSELKTASAIVLNGLLKVVRGAQTWSGGMTLPSGTYLQHPPQYYPPSQPLAAPADVAPVQPAGPATVPTPSGAVAAPAFSGWATAPSTGQPAPTAEKKTADTPKVEEPKKTRDKKDSSKPTTSSSRGECCEPAAPAAAPGCSCPRTKAKKKSTGTTDAKPGQSQTGMDPAYWYGWGFR